MRQLPAPMSAAHHRSPPTTQEGTLKVSATLTAKSNSPSRLKRGRVFLSSLLATSVVVAGSLTPFGQALVQAATPPVPATIQEPPPAPHSIIAFPARDFVTGGGFTPGDPHTVRV